MRGRKSRSQAWRRDDLDNFAIPAHLQQKRYVKGVESRPDNPKVVYHVFVRADTTSQSRVLEQKETEPDFPGIGGPRKFLMAIFSGGNPGVFQDLSLAGWIFPPVRGIMWLKTP